MHIEDETLCCNAALKDRREIYGERKCVTEVTAFSLICLEREVLETALSGWDRIVGENNAICNKIVQVYGIQTVYIMDSRKTRQ